jgi:ABC transporter fused permease/ATP-binding protein
MARSRRDPEDLDEQDVPPAKISLQTLRQAVRLAGYLWPYRVRFILAIVSLFLGSTLALAFPRVTGLLIDALNAPASEVSASWQQSIDGVALLLILILGLQAVFAFGQSYWFVTVGERSLADLRRDTYARLIRLPMVFHTQRRVGELASRLAADLTQIQDTLVMAIPHLLRQVAILVGGVVMIAMTSGRLTLVMLSSLPLLILIAVIFGRSIRRASRLAQDRLAESNVIVQETLQGVATVKAFTNERHEENRYRKSLDHFIQAVLRGALARGAFVSFIVFALFGAIVLVLWFGAREVRAGELTVGQLTQFMLYTLFVGGAMGSFAELYSQLQRTLGATERVRELLGEPMESLSIGTAGKTGRLRGEVVFENLAFRYPSRPEVQVLHDISLSARPGQRIALVGPSGAGKSTMVSLLLRFYDPEKGRVLVDGVDVRDYPLEELRGQMAMVPQDVLLFGGTIAENIGYGRPGAKEEEIMAAALKANAHDFIASFPEGYQTRVGERGMQLSGGQRQRVAIARAILRDPAILILDEATSSLDSESESLVLQALDRLMEGRTSLVIAHRLSTVRRADCIYVLKEGRTIEAGTHAELIARPDGVYRTLSELQFEE